ncbi:MAG: ABC transporter permease subunit [Thermomicrobiales bacterium]|nr:ABC transporter permease subunit [Thermomicrobiales bacterium]
MTFDYLFRRWDRVWALTLEHLTLSGTAILVALIFAVPLGILAARGLGMTRWQEFWRVRWPLALPVMIAGLRTAAVTTISLATIAAWIGAGGLGTLLFEGITRNDPDRILAGAIAITTLAVLTDALLRFVESRTAIRRAQAAAR